MCTGAIMDNWFGIDRPTPQQPTVIDPLPPQIANPTAAEKQGDIAPSSDAQTLRAKRRGTSSLKIDRATGVSSAGLNIPQA